MSRNVADYTIDNDTGANVRSQLNNLLNDIKTLNAAAGDISDKDAYQLFVNTTTGKLCIIDSDGSTVNTLPVDISDDDLMHAFTLGGNITFADGTIKNTAGVLQVKQDVLTTTMSTVSTSWTSVTGLDVSITPLNNKSKFLILLDMRAHLACSAAADQAYYRLRRDSTSICVGAAAGSRLQVTGQIPGYYGGSQYQSISTVGGAYYDSPATASSIVYSVQVISPSTNTITINRTYADTDSTSYGRAASALTVIEIGGA